MSSAFKCDRCGELREGHRALKLQIEPRTEKGVEQIDKCVMDFCLECTKELAEWRFKNE